MATAISTTFVVNAAFLQEIKDCNPDLWSRVAMIRPVCHSNESAIDVLRRLTRMLDDLRDDLALQFSLEESYGYMVVGEPMNEAVSELACKAQSEHGELYLELSDLAEQAEELQYRGVELSRLKQLIEDTLKFDERLRKHEELESDLIDQAVG